jgi:hypothetical protein
MAYLGNRAEQGARANEHSRHASGSLIDFRMKLPTRSSNVARVAPAVVVAVMRIQEFYTTEDPNILRQKLFDIMAISMAAYR